MVSPNNEYQHPNFPLLVGKDSLNNLSLHEFHTPLAGNTDEDSHFMQNPSSSSSSSSPPIVLGDIDSKGTSCRRNVEQVWKESFYQPLDNATNNMCFRQQLAHGVTTYQEFLVRKYGNAQNSINVAIDPTAMADSNFKVAELGNMDSQLRFPQQVERKHCRSMNETMEKTVERRQRRMIKNRESAARCRARKQAYTNMLEHQVSDLRRRNEWLKKLKEAKMVLHSDPPSMPRYQLRRLDAIAMEHSQAITEEIRSEFLYSLFVT